METACSETLKQQFQTIQEQQQKKLQRRKQLQDEKNNKLSDPPKNGNYLSEELVDHLNSQIRELKDENGRLYKLLSERDFELRQLRKKKETEAKTVTAGVTNETAATKIVELSKKVRELTAELEGEKTKGKQLGKKCQELHSKLLESKVPGETKSKKSVNNQSQSLRSLTDDGQVSDEAEVKALQEKLRQAEARVTEFRNQCLTLRQELKVAQKVLSQEIGEAVNIQSLLSNNSNWRGRAQQILTLQKKVSELKSKLESQTPDDLDLEDEMMGPKPPRKPTADDRHRDQLRKLEKERKESQERAAAELQALEQDYESMKQKLDACKARNKVLSNEVKALKQQKQTLLDKGRHDDELITALMQQLQQMKNLLDDSSKSQKEKGDKQQEKLKELSMKTQQDNNIVEQLKAIVTEKEIKVKRLEDEIQELKLNHLQKNQLDAVGALFNQHSEMHPVTPGDNEMMVVQSVSPPQSRLSERPHFSVSVTSVHAQESTRCATRNSRRPTSAASVKDKLLLADLENECKEYRTLAQVAAVERDKLTELVQVLQRRLDESYKDLSDSQSELMQHRRKTVQLEKQLGKAALKLDQGNSNKPGVKKKVNSKVIASVSLNNLDDSDLLDDNNVDELQISLSIQRDENEALKAALQSTLKAKEEDLRMYSETMEETKKVFIQALRQHKQ